LQLAFRVRKVASKLVLITFPLDFLVIWVFMGSNRLASVVIVPIFSKKLLLILKKMNLSSG
jgi:hypothetical protein